MMRLLSIVFLFWLLPLSALANPLQLDLLVSRDGVYSVSFEALSQHGLEPVDADRLMLTNRDEPIAFWIDGDDDNRFGPKDRLTFLAQHLPGQYSYYNTESPYNVYRLEVGRGGRKGQTIPATSSNDSDPAYVVQHLEQDKLRVRFNFLRIESQTEVWYWERLSTLDRTPFALNVDLGRVSELDDRHPVSIKINLRGWSTAHADNGMPDHQVDVMVNGEPVGTAQWQGQDSTTLELDSIPANLLVDGNNVIQLSVPKRRFGEKNSLFVDVSLLNWIVLSYPFDGTLTEGQIELKPTTARGVSLMNVPSGSKFYTRGGKRFVIENNPKHVRVDETTVTLVAGERLRVPIVRRNEPSSLLNRANQADYLMIAHSSLKEAVKPLADFHRKNGLAVDLIDVQDIYDEFNGGIVSAESIKAFVSHAYHQWSKPAPRFVLLVGDASWDNQLGEEKDRNYADWTAGRDRPRWFGKNGSTPYVERFNDRNLVPTFQVPTFEGFAASDSALVSVEGDDWYPDLAVGRFPVVTPGEVSAIVDKIISYAQQSNRPAKWRRNLLVITNDLERMQRKSDKLIANNNDVGLAATRVYPKEREKDNRQNISRLREALNEGQLLVHFLGHGGRYIWRTGPPDLKKNHDLFTLDDIDQLTPNTHLPLVLSMTCYSAPFDHPTADSIGEKFLRTPDRGAVGILAASWRNSPSPKFSQRLLAELTQQDSTIGEAIMRAKRGFRQKVLVETYNLLGDPALQLVFPRQGIQASAIGSEKQRGIQISVNLQAIQGLRDAEVLFELLDEDDHVLAQRTEHIDGTELAFVWPQVDLDAARRLRIYAWNDATGVDAIGSTPVNDDTSSQISRIHY